MEHGACHGELSEIVSMYGLILFPYENWSLLESIVTLINPNYSTTAKLTGGRIGRVTQHTTHCRTSPTFSEMHTVTGSYLQVLLALGRRPCTIVVLQIWMKFGLNIAGHQATGKAARQSWRGGGVRGKSQVVSKRCYGDGSQKGGGCVAALHSQVGAELEVMEKESLKIDLLPKTKCKPSHYKKKYLELPSMQPHLISCECTCEL